MASESSSGQVRRLALIAAAFLYLAIFLVIPLIAVFSEALAKGLLSRSVVVPRLHPQMKEKVF